MKACVALAAALLGAVCAGATTLPTSAADLRIRPGFGIGNLRLGMTEAEARRRMGAPRAVVRRTAGFGLRSVEYQYGLADYTVRFLGRPGRLRAVRVTTVLRRERTPRGIGPGSLERDLRRAYPAIRCERLRVAVVAGITFVATNGRDCALVTGAGRRTIFRTSVYLPTRETLTVSTYLRRARVDEVVVEAAA